ncbi:immunity protein TriTu family protein [Candidatus Marithrix sp. Canyon 246]|uniref:immunity protein TriTu family protein n=1 Tax=Candidatus Marithrix sp. Canyon 246 TaxID=1827136 RepID=UPI00084A0611|nr:hypothetical protein [Candidatus Marithrix sp. Canyon 246]
MPISYVKPTSYEGWAKIMIKQFEKWLSEKESFLRQKGFAITISHSPTNIEKFSICVDIDILYI